MKLNTITLKVRRHLGPHVTWEDEARGPTWITAVADAVRVAMRRDPLEAVLLSDALADLDDIRKPGRISIPGGNVTYILEMHDAVRAYDHPWLPITRYETLLIRIAKSRHPDYHMFRLLVAKHYALAVDDIGPSQVVTAMSECVNRLGLRGPGGHTVEIQACEIHDDRERMKLILPKGIVPLTEPHLSLFEALRWRMRFSLVRDIPGYTSRRGKASV